MAEEIWRKFRFKRNEKLFSYGTLQYEQVQLATFGRKLKGSADVLEGYQLQTLTITDPDVLEKSGDENHPVLYHSGNVNDTVQGQVFDISTAELQQADEYEVSDYKRISVKLRSGVCAWVYVAVEA